MVDANIREYLSTLAEDDPGKVIWVDSRRRPELYRHAVVKPNQQEAEEACLRLFGKVDYERLRRHINTRLLLVTHGGDGVLLVEQGRQAWIKTRPNPAPVDICGAGDSFSAGAALAYQITSSAEEAARFGNIVASITITKKGTGTATPEEVLAASREMPR